MKRMLQEKAGGVMVLVLLMLTMMACLIFMYAQLLRKNLKKEKTFYTLTRESIKRAFLCLKKWQRSIILPIPVIRCRPLFLIMITMAISTCTCCKQNLHKEMLCSLAEETRMIPLKQI